MPISGLSCVRTDGGTEVLHEALADLKRMLFALIDDQGISIVLFSVRSVLLYTYDTSCIYHPESAEQPLLHGNSDTIVNSYQLVPQPTVPAAHR